MNQSCLPKSIQERVHERQSSDALTRNVIILQSRKQPKRHSSSSKQQFNTIQATNKEKDKPDLESSNNEYATTTIDQSPTH
jgi:hypothetical protein